MKMIRIKEATKKGYVEIHMGECFDAENPNSETRRGRKMETKSNCLMAKDTDFMRYERLLKIVRHHKYKRCLAMAKICYLRFVRYENYLQKLCASNATIASYKFRRDMYDKWEKRWLEFAEKFKEA